MVQHQFLATRQKVFFFLIQYTHTHREKKDKEENESKPTTSTISSSIYVLYHTGNKWFMSEICYSGDRVFYPTATFSLSSTTKTVQKKKKKKKKKTWSRYDALPASFLGRFENDDLAPDICITFLFVLFWLCTFWMRAVPEWIRHRSPPPLSIELFNVSNGFFFLVFSRTNQTNKWENSNSNWQKKNEKKNDINNGNILNDMQIRCNTSKMISATSKRRFPPPRISLCFVPLFFLFFFPRSYRTVIICSYPFFVCVFIVCNTGGGKNVL